MLPLEDGLQCPIRRCRAAGVEALRMDRPILCAAIPLGDGREADALASWLAARGLPQSEPVVATENANKKRYSAFLGRFI